MRPHETKYGRKKWTDPVTIVKHESPFKWKLLSEQYFPVVLLTDFYKGITDQNYELNLDHSDLTETSEQRFRVMRF